MMVVVVIMVTGDDKKRKTKRYSENLSSRRWRRCRKVELGGGFPFNSSTFTSPGPFLL